MGKLAKSSIIVSIIVMIGFFIGAVSNMFIYPNICSKEDLGVYRYVNNWGTFFSPICTLGIGGAVVRMFYRFRDKHHTGELNALLFLVPLITSIVFSLLFIPLSGYFFEATTTDNSFDNQIWSIMLCTLVLSITMGYARIYSAIGNILKKAPAMFFINELLLRTVTIVIFFLYFYHWLDFRMFLASLCLLYIIQLVVILYVIRDFIFSNPFVIPKKDVYVPVIKLGLFCMLDSGANTLVTQIDLIMVGAICADSFVRMQEYTMAISVAIIILLPWRSMTSTTVPFIGEAFHRNDIPAVEDIYKRSSLNLFLSGAIIFIFIYASIDNIIAIIPDNYAVIKYPVLFLGISKLIDMLGSVNNNIIVLSPFYKYNLYFNLFLVGIVFLANWILIPLYGITGSAVATVIGVLLFNIMKGWLIYKKYGIHPFHRNTADVVLFLGLIFAVSLFIPDMFGNSVLLNIFFRSAVIFVMVYGYLVWRKPSEDAERIRVKSIRMLLFRKK